MDIMLDLETMSTLPNAAIASIGAVAFDPYGNDTPEKIAADRRSFYVNVDLKQQSDPRNPRHFDGDTIRWWLQQSPAAREALVRPEPLECTQAYLRLFDFYAAHSDLPSPTDGRCWSYGASFDNVIIEDFSRWLQRPSHFVNHRKQWCARTVINMVEVPMPTLAGNVAHNAVDDCIMQVIQLQQAIKALRRPKRLVQLLASLEGDQSAEITALREELREGLK